MTTDLRCRVIQMHRVAALHQDAGAFGPRRPRAHYQDGILGSLLGKPLWMPTTTILFARGCILSTDHGRPTDLPTRDTHVATDTDADVVIPSLFNLFRQPGIGNGRTGGTDDVGESLGDNLRHFLRIGKAAYAEHGLLHHGLDDLGPRHLVALEIETRRARVLTPLRDVTDIDIPQVDQGIGQLRRT